MGRRSRSGGLIIGFGRLDWDGIICGIGRLDGMGLFVVLVDWMGKVYTLLYSTLSG